MQVELLKQHFQRNSAVKAICDHMAKRTKNQNETSLHRILYYLEQEGSDFKRSDVIAAFRLLEEAECGKYIEGRHGWKSRFIWSVKSKLVSGAAQGTQTKAALVAEDDPIEEIVEDEMIEHIYALRPDLNISFELPADLSQNEAARLSKFIKTLSFEE
jgi:hypothetical protein